MRREIWNRNKRSGTICRRRRRRRLRRLQLNTKCVQPLAVCVCVCVHANYQKDEERVKTHLYMHTIRRPQQAERWPSAFAEWTLIYKEISGDIFTSETLSTQAFQLIIVHNLHLDYFCYRPRRKENQVSIVAIGFTFVCIDSPLSRFRPSVFVLCLWFIYVNAFQAHSHRMHVTVA